MKVFISKYSYYILGVLLLIIIWAVYANSINNSMIAPTVTEVASTLWTLLGDSQSYLMILYTILKIVGVICASFIISLIFACLSLASEKIEYLIRPLIVILRTLPVAAIIMILLVIFFKQSIRYTATMIVSGMVVTPIIYEAILASFKSVDKNIIDDLKTLTNNNFQTMMHINFPIAAPSIVVAIVQSFGLGLKVLIMAEVIMLPPNTIGKIIGEYASWGELSFVFAWSIILLLLVIGFDVIFNLVKKKVTNNIS